MHLQNALRLIAQQKEYPLKQVPGEYKPIPEPVGYVYHVSPYAKEILEEGFKIDRSKSTLGSYSQVCSVSTTTYENAVAYRDGIRTIVSAVNGTLSTPELLAVLIANGIDDVNYQVMFVSAMEHEFNDSLLGVPEEYRKNYTSLYEWRRSPDASKYFESIARNETDFDGNPLSQDAIAQRNWMLMKYSGPYAKIPFVCNQLPEHLKTRTAEDVQIVEVAVAPAEYVDDGTPPSVDRGDEPKGKYTYHPGEYEWRHYDVTDLWPVRIVGTDHLNKALHIISISRNKLNSIKQDIASAAQKVYDEWTQDEEGIDEELGAGGICQDIAEAIVGVLDNYDIESVSHFNEIGEVHVDVIAKFDDGVYIVDIPPYVYESGAGYDWKKLPDITFTPDHVYVERIDDVSQWENYVDQY